MEHPSKLGGMLEGSVTIISDKKFEVTNSVVFRNCLSFFFEIFRSFSQSGKLKSTILIFSKNIQDIKPVIYVFKKL